jgi:hypothetical protein
MKQTYFAWFGLVALTVPEKQDFDVSLLPFSPFGRRPLVRAEVYRRIWRLSQKRLFLTTKNTKRFHKVHKGNRVGHINFVTFAVSLCSLRLNRLLRQPLMKLRPFRSTDAQNHAAQSTNKIYRSSFIVHRL